MNIDDLKAKELSNLYAMFKQTNDYFDGSEISFLTEKKQLMLTYYIKHTCGLEEQITETLRDMGINPGNTKDSIAEEMTENLKEIIKEEIEDGVKEVGYLLSLNRLMSYQISNLENLQFFQENEASVVDILSSLDEFRNVQKSIFN
ncbi:hypothetical protein [Portibacter marinus]|uniref:hypothetical protein n=1 Tax=Portibacter marinus TaxID=2898660 RepID=UPI001F330E43|nr:hypothetical protein [Portibacter marinus]